MRRHEKIKFCVSIYQALNYKYKLKMFNFLKLFETYFSLILPSATVIISAMLMRDFYNLKLFFQMFDLLHFQTLA